MISFAASASNMENDTVEQARASNMEEDKASSRNKGKYFNIASALFEHKRVSNIVEKLNDEMRSMSSEQNSSEKRISIYSVPKPLRDVNWKVYAPLLISIGPLHRGNKILEAMEKEKLKYLKKLITYRDGMDEKMCDIVISIKKQEERLRYCYSKEFKKTIESDDFAKMILLDAVFIIMFFLESNFEPRMTFDIREDLILLENQLPFFIIQDIYDRVCPCSPPFLVLATCYLRDQYSFLKKVETSPGVKGSRHLTDLLRNLMLCKTILGVEIETSSDVEIETSLGVEGSSPLHFTDLLRHLMLRGATEPSEYILNPPMLKYSAVMLRNAGVKFQVSRDKCLVNITFDKRVLKIPHLKIDHCFERLVRNIMALEQCCYPSDAYICSYIKFMDHLIDSAEDVRLLVGKGIIVHTLGDDAAVSNMINSLCENIGDNYTCFDYTCFGDISRKLNDHHASLFNRAMATLLLVYFPNFWRGTATLAAALLLILTFIQTLSSLKLFG
uniref:Uncharacterized protein n=1 Tax=Salix viminalis TaxID=40686 RepID=A0A6N2L115_SALVM